MRLFGPKGVISTLTTALEEVHSRTPSPLPHTMGVFPPRQFEAGVAIRSREGTCPVEGYRPIRLLICDGRFVEKFDDGYVRISEGNLLLTGIQEISSTDEVPPELAAHTLGLVTVTQGEVTFGIALPRHRLPEIDLLTLGL